MENPSERFVQPFNTIRIVAKDAKNDWESTNKEDSARPAAVREAKDDKDGDGRWVTMNGHHVLIKNDESSHIAGHDWDFASGSKREQKIHEENIDKHGIKYHDRDELHPDTFQSVRRYTKSAYGELNGKLREDADYQKLDNNNREIHDHLEKFIHDSGVLSKPVTVWRGMTGGVTPTTHLDYEKLIGKTVRMDGFQSTSFAPGVAEQFSDPTLPLFEIRTKRGGFIHGKLTAMPGEDEFLLGHGWHYKVVGIDKMPSHQFPGHQINVVKLEVV